jgi:hypothetical protein
MQSEKLRWMRGKSQEDPLSASWSRTSEEGPHRDCRYRKRGLAEDSQLREYTKEELDVMLEEMMSEIGKTGGKWTQT